MRVSRWRGDPRVAHVTPVAEAPPLTTAMVSHCCNVLAERGYQAVVTSALAGEEQRSFLDHGFDIEQQLHLLAHDMRLLPAVLQRSGGVRLRRGRRFDRSETVALDNRAFPPFWRLDRAGLEEAITATPHAWYRVVTAGHLVGYAVTGRAGSRGYLQRLAVDPESAGRGLGALLVVDALHWMAGRGVSRAVVNTQVDNERALRLYERLGFVRQAAGLAVLGRPLGERQRAP